MKAEEYIKSLPLNPSESSFKGSAVKISRIRKYQDEVDHSPFSVKLVLDGEETYWVNGRKFVVGKDQFLVVDRHSNIQFDIDCSRVARGICFYPSHQLISSIVHGITTSKEEQLDDPEAIPSEFKFTEHIFRLNDTRAGQWLGQKYASLEGFHNPHFNTDWDSFMMGFCEHLVQDQISINGHLSALPSQKRSTKEELFRRVSTAKRFLEEHLSEAIDLEEVSRHSHLSKYYFVRSFKAIYGLSPIQYLLRLRLSKARVLRQKGYSYADIAFRVGFSDPGNLRKSLQRSMVH